jgi:hypothetical protein
VNLWLKWGSTSYHTGMTNLFWSGFLSDTSFRENWMLLTKRLKISPVLSLVHINSDISFLTYDFQLQDMYGLSCKCQICSLRKPFHGHFIWYVWWTAAQALWIPKGKRPGISWIIVRGDLSVLPSLNTSRFRSKRTLRAGLWNRESSLGHIPIHIQACVTPTNYGLYPRIHRGQIVSRRAVGPRWHDAVALHNSVHNDNISYLKLESINLIGSEMWHGCYIRGSLIGCFCSGAN